MSGTKLGWDRMKMDYDCISMSYTRCLQSDGFFDTFYEIFLAKSPEIPLLFADTDFVRQKEVLKLSIPYMLSFAAGQDYAKEDMTRLGEVHGRTGRSIEARLYPFWLDSLCESIEEHDPEWDSELENLWRQVMQPGIDFLISKY